MYSAGPSTTQGRTYGNTNGDQTRFKVISLQNKLSDTEVQKGQLLWCGRVAHVMIMFINHRQ